MALRHLVYRCPLCGAPGTEGSGDRARCPRCAATVVRHPGGRLAVSDADGGRRLLPPGQVVDEMRALGGPETEPPGERLQTRATLTELVGADPVHRGDRLLGWAERAGPARAGTVWLEGSALGFTDEQGREERWPLHLVRSVQVASKALQIGAGKPLRHFSLELDTASPFRWEALLQQRLEEAQSKVRVLEWQPRIFSDEDEAEARGREPAARRRPRRVRAAGSAPSMPLYSVARRLIGLLLPLRVRLSVEGVQHVPRTGPCVLVVNHQSIVDAPLVQTVCPRPVRAMTKSTQFRSPLWSRLLTALGAFPVRRFTPDPQAVRTALRILERGEVLAVYPEGERSWDGRLQPFRRGTLRFLVSVGVPVVPVAIVGSYALWPRWSRRMERGPVAIRFGAPLRLPTLTRRPRREEAVPRTAAALRRAFEELGVAGPREPAPKSVPEAAT